MAGSNQDPSHNYHRGAGCHLSQSASNILVHQIRLKKYLDAMDDEKLGRMFRRASFCQRSGNSANILWRLVMFYACILNNSVSVWFSSGCGFVLRL